MKGKLTAAEKWWNEIAEYEATHEIAFAAPKALMEARILNATSKTRRPSRRPQNQTAGRKSRESVAA